MVHVIRPEDALAVLACVSIVYLVLVFFILRRTQALELKLLVLGLVTALLAVWCGQSGVQGPTTVQVGPGQGGGLFIGGDVAGTLGRIGLLLVLGAIAVGILSQCNTPVVSSSREEAIREHKN